MTGIVALILVAAAVIAAATTIIRETLALRRERLSLLADCVDLLDGGRIEADPAGYGVLKGRYRGVEVALRPFSESLAFRRLPQLWLAASVRAPTGLDATIDILRRPSGGEFYSPGADLARRFAPRPSWPADTRIQASGEANATLDGLEIALAGPLSDDRTKNVTLTPRGVRVVVQHRQGERGAYLIYRDGRFRDARVTRKEALDLLETTFSISRVARELPHGPRPDDALFQAA